MGVVRKLADILRSAATMAVDIVAVGWLEFLFRERRSGGSGRFDAPKCGPSITVEGEPVQGLWAHRSISRKQTDDV